ncbi:MAG TPA: SCO family protein [Steroidobacteraceae bacterium]|nr:SCO family protein [Steroidobacteraceae bacterium]
MSRSRTYLYLGLMILAAAAAGYMVARQLQDDSPALAAGTRLPEPRPVTAFSLQDHQGAAFGNAQLAGRPSLLFFGFTHCPDVCPTTLALMAQLAREPRLAGLHLVFVTVDPHRDDLHTLASYVQAFGGSITGVRGEDAQLEPLLQSLGVARSVQQLAGGEYSVDHSATLFFVDAQGRLAAVFTPPFSFPALRDDLAALVPAGT